MDTAMTRRAWSSREDAKLRALYKLGTRALLSEFPGRSRNSIRARAAGLGLRIPRIEPPSCLRYRGKIADAPHAHPFVRKLVSEANRRGYLLHEVAEEAGVTRAAISKWRHKVTPHLVGLIACLNVVGLDLAIVRKKDDSSNIAVGDGT